MNVLDPFNNSQPILIIFCHILFFANVMVFYGKLTYHLTRNLWIGFIRTMWIKNSGKAHFSCVLNQNEHQSVLLHRNYTLSRGCNRYCEVIAMLWGSQWVKYLWYVWICKLRWSICQHNQFTNFRLIAMRRDLQSSVFPFGSLC